MKTFDGLKLKRARIRKNLSVPELAYLIHNKGFKVTERSLHNWESGKSVPSGDAVYALTVVLEKEAAFFFSTDHVKAL